MPTLQFRFYDSTNNQCQSINSLVEHCFVYEVDGACQICKPGFVIKSPVKCVVGDIPGCSTCDGISECVECQEGFYLKHPSECRLYSSGLNCRVFDPERDRCESCFNQQEMDGRPAMLT